jgi:hypothetical protein
MCRRSIGRMTRAAKLACEPQSKSSAAQVAITIDLILRG